MSASLDSGLRNSAEEARAVLNIRLKLHIGSVTLEVETHPALQGESVPASAVVLRFGCDKSFSEWLRVGNIKGTRTKETTSEKREPSIYFIAGPAAAPCTGLELSWGATTAAGSNGRERKEIGYPERRALPAWIRK